ncbi:MAG: GFA family protein [Rhodospirillales bacterium]|nr:GFA family protein [Rhodospirillales bacterium]MBO6788295.1 GFA family protein [Rhodospirillales bacterium]
MREARCGCGALTVETPDDPKLVIQCHCTDCQRRTGAPFGVGAYFDRNDVHATGKSTAFARTGDAGRTLENHFCPVCGTTVFWFVEFNPDFVGVAAGCFNDPAFPAPNRSVFERSKVKWVTVPEGVACFDATSV